MPAAFKGTDHPLSCILIRPRRGRHQNVRKIAAPVVMRRSAQGPGQRHVRADFEFGGISDRNTTIDQRPARTVPASVLDPEVENGRIGNRSSSGSSIELLRVNAVRQRL